MKTETILKLRNKQTLNLFDRENKLFVKIQLNKKTKNICWQRFVSADKKNWINWNEYLSLKDISNIIDKIKHY
jgi:hypothetical protein